MKTDKAEKKSAYDLEDRTLKFAGNVRAFVKELPRSIANSEDSSQVVRSSSIDTGGKVSLDERRDALYQEARELMFILSSIMRKVQD